jgi:hypothetical protein
VVFVMKGGKVFENLAPGSKTTLAAKAGSKRLPFVETFV